jgi:hypothetical protein
MKNQKFHSVICQSLMAASLVLASPALHALSIDWAGNYRFEYVDIDKTSLDDPKNHKAYVLNHLSLSPKIIAADGVNIVAKFEVLPNDQYPDSQAGQTFGKGPTPRSAAGSSTNDDSAVAGDHHGASNLKVSQLYLNVNQEFGSLVAGRAPLDFGLGITHSAGNGLWDHWGDTRDMVGYKFIIGNFSLMPMLAKVYDYSVAQGREAQDMIWDMQYNNPETESAIGLMHQTRNASQEANDAPFAAYGATGNTGRWNTQTVSLFLSRGFEDFKFKIETGFESGGTGMTLANAEEIKLNGFGIALELDFPQPTSKWHYNLRMGMASGDNPDTTNYEGFHFHRNYDVAFLMFNHPMGRYDLLRTAVQRSSDRLNNVATPYATDEALDDEAISNAVYVSPKIVYNLSDKWDWTNTITWGQLQTTPLAAGVDVSKDLGFEWDTGLTFRPHERITWVNEIGLFFPGAAWSGSPTQNFGKSFNMGLSSKAAISF